MIHKIELVVFDIAGTTVKDNGEITLAFQQAMRKYGYQLPAAEVSPLMGYKKTEAIRKMLVAYEKDNSRITDKLVNTIHEVFLQKMVEYYTNTPLIEAFENTVAVFEWLRSHSIAIGLDTGFPREITSVIIGRLGWLRKGLVDAVISSNEVPAGRPEPFMIRHLMQKTGVKEPMAVVKVGDTEVDVMEGRNAGCMYSIAVTTGAFTRGALLPYQPSHIVDDIAEIKPILLPHL